MEADNLPGIVVGHWAMARLFGSPPYPYNDDHKLHVLYAGPCAPRRFTRPDRSIIDMIPHFHNRVLPAILLLATLPYVPAMADEGYADTVTKDEPVAWWRLNADGKVTNAGSVGAALDGVATGVHLNHEGPRPGMFPDFDKANQAGLFGGPASRVVIPGE